MTTISKPSRARVRLSAGAAILRDTPTGRRYLLLRAYNYWDFPKGEVEAGEAPLDAAIREVREETGLTRLEFHWGEGYCETEPYNRGKVARYYLASTPDEQVTLAANPVTGVHEHMEYRWLSYPQAAKLVVPRVKLILDWAESRVTGAGPDTGDPSAGHNHQPDQG